jgi:glycerol uptake facilitator-like aquaporin
MDGRPNLPRRAAAEGFGAFALVFAGCGAIVADTVHRGALGAVGVSLVFGLVIMAMVYATGHLSGAHLNPAVTLAFVLTRHFPHREALAYVGAQLLGAIAAAALLLAVWPSQPADLGTTLPSVGDGSAFAYEAVLTAFLMFTIMAVATDARAVGAGAAIAIGGTVGLDALFGGPITDAKLIQRGSDIDPAWLEGVGSVGVTAGASAPEALVREVVDRLSEWRAVEEHTLVTAEEKMIFKLPRQLVD